MVRYWNNPVATAEVLVELPGGRQGFRTGDLGRISHGDRLQITGRANEQYKLDNGKFVVSGNRSRWDSFVPPLVHSPAITVTAPVHWQVPGPIEDTLRLWSPFVEQAFLYGINRAHNVMLVVPDFEAVARHLELTGDEATPNSIVSNPSVAELFESELVTATDRMRKEGVLPHYATPQQLHLLPEPFTIENGLLTPKLSTKRKAIVQRYSDVLDDLYSSHESSGASH
jgi:long-chain acyl-CoA synthetase